MNARYQIHVIDRHGCRSLLTGYGRAKGTWDAPAVSLRTARNHAREFVRKFPEYKAGFEKVTP